MKSFKRIITLFLTLTLLCSCSVTNKKEKYTKVYFDYFDTVTNVIGYDESEEHFNEICDFIGERLAYYDSLYDGYNALSDVTNIYKINKNAGIEPVTVDKDILDLFKVSIDIYDKTNGKTNFAMGAVLRYWHDAREDADYDPENAYVPDINDLKEAAKHCNIEDIIIDEENSTVYFKDPLLKVDVGAIAKGYAIEKIIKELKDLGVTNYSLNVGGNVRVIDTKADGKDWVVAIQNPDIYSDNAYVEVLNINDLALTTSGSYQRYYVVRGVKYHHIINPDTLFPENNFLSVSILNNDATMGDALSTALFNMTLDEGMELINNTENTEAMWILSDETKVYTDGFKEYIKK